MCHGQFVVLGYQFLVRSFPRVAEPPHHCPYAVGICVFVVFVQPTLSITLHGTPKEFGKQLQVLHVARRCSVLLVHWKCCFEST